jgi:hypothetical protein
LRKKCKRRVWSTDINPIAHAIAGAAITDKESLDKLRLSELSSIDNMVYGRGTVEDWRFCADILNISETMGVNGIGPEVLPYCQLAQQALFEAAKRYETTGKMGLSGLGIKAIKDVWEYHDLQRSSIARSEYERMIQKTANYIKSQGKNVVEVV